ncbi:MAG: dihydroxyacetone kinase subunit L [Chloroflexi bacterium]|nr:dihydroxyacetone kinase subunit L [Chloroflexota bacterium]
MSNSVDAQVFRRWIRECARVIAEQRDALTALDAAIGDADHGVNMDRGFKAALPRVDSLPADATPGAVVRAVGAALMSSVGGASGPLWGSALRQAGRVLGEASEVDGRLLADALDGAVQAIQKLGGAQPGDKTMVDALAPAVEALRASVEAGGALDDALAAARAAAEAGRDATIPLQARKGRASYLGERSIGHQDPGATSAALVLGALEKAAHAHDHAATQGR